MTWLEKCSSTKTWEDLGNLVALGWSFCLAINCLAIWLWTSASCLGKWKQRYKPPCGWMEKFQVMQAKAVRHGIEASTEAGGWRESMKALCQSKLWHSCHLCEGARVCVRAERGLDAKWAAHYVRRLWLCRSPPGMSVCILQQHADLSDSEWRDNFGLGLGLGWKSKG